MLWINYCLGTHTFNDRLSGTTQVSRYQKGKTNLDFTETRDSEWQWHQLGHMQVCILLQTDNNHASTPPLSFLQAGCPSCRPTNSVKALKAMYYLGSLKDMPAACNDAKSWYSIKRPRRDARLSWPSWLSCYMQRWYTRPKTVTHPSTNRARRALTPFLRRTPLTTSQPLVCYLFICVGVECWNPAFDVTPAALITGGIVTEYGVYRPHELKHSLMSVVRNHSPP